MENPKMHDMASLNLSIFHFYPFYLIVNLISLGSTMLVRQTKQCEYVVMGICLDSYLIIYRQRFIRTILRR